MISQPLYVLALDLAVNSGYCAGAPGERLRFGTWRLKTADDDRKQAARKLGRLIRDECEFRLPDLIVYEATMSAGAMLQAGNASHTADLLWQISGAVEGVAACYGCRTATAHVQSVRKKFLGVARPPEPKKAVMAHCRELGYQVSNDNEADAIAIYLTQQGYIFGELSLAGVSP